MKFIATEIVETSTKRDTNGRHYHNISEREAIMAEYDKSNLTQRAFTEREGIRYNTFTTWLMHRRLKIAKNSNNFAEITLPKAKAAQGNTFTLEIILQNGTIMRGSNTEQLVEVLKAIRSC